MAINTVIIAEIRSAIGCAYKIPLIPTKLGNNKIIGTKQIPCLQAPKINPSKPYLRQEIEKNTPYKIQKA